jgi:hypothetical protein
MANIRTFSCFRRRPHIVDLLTPVVSGATVYTIKWGQNFDTATFTDIIDCSNVGYYDDNIPRNKTELQNTNGFVRITFDPTTFSIDDTKSFWLQLWETVPPAASAQVSACTLLLPDSALKGQGNVTIEGSAPSEASSAAALQLDLPSVVQNFQITNTVATGGNILYVSTEQGGPEMAIGPGLGFPGYQTIWGAQGSIWVRANGAGGATFSATFTLAFPR